MAESQNIFWLARYQDANEDQLTEMLCWLISIVPEVGSLVVRLAMPGSGVVEPVEASTQHVIPKGRLDLLVEAGGALIVVECKLDAEFGPDQLKKYVEWVAERDEPPARVVLALTERAMPWPENDAARARELSVGHESARWADLYVLLDQLKSELGETQARLVSEFCELLEEEGLIPVEPLDSNEVAGAWSKAFATISHYHEFFRAAVDSIAQVIDAKVVSGKSETMWWTYRTFEQSGEVLWLGMSCEDLTHLPFVWMSRDVDWPDVDALAKRLAPKLPAGWVVDVKVGFYGRPLVACPLPEVITNKTFEAQSTQIATSCGAALQAWREAG